jgi:hypothetical protein
MQTDAGTDPAARTGRFDLSRPRVTTVVLFLTGALVGLMAYHGDVSQAVFVVASLVGVVLHGRYAGESDGRSVVANGLLLIAGAVVGYAAYIGNPGWTPVVVGCALVALVFDARASRSRPR